MMSPWPPMQPDLTLGQAVRQGAELLEREGVEAPRLTAEVLLAHALGKDRTYLIAHSNDRLSELAWIHYGRWLHERMGGKPTQYITRQQEFYGRTFHVEPGVLIPRPETEHLIEAVLELPSIEGPIVDVGSGSGCIAITLALELKRTVFAVDISGRALEIARGNAHQLGADVQFLEGDLLTAVGSAALVVSNPPYVPALDELAREVRDWEPELALFGGEDGLDVWRRLVPQAARVLMPGGWLIGEIDARAEMAPLFGGWCEFQVLPDLAGRPRIVRARR